MYNRLRVPSEGDFLGRISQFGNGRRNEPGGGRRRQPPGETTGRESGYIDWLSKNRVPVVIKLIRGEELRGWIEYYDRDIVRLTRNNEANLFIYKDRIKYLFEDPAYSNRRRIYDNG